MPCLIAIYDMKSHKRPDIPAACNLSPNQTCLIGKNVPAGNLLLDDLCASRNHASLTVDAAGKYLVTDLSSTNGTQILSHVTDHWSNLLKNVPVAIGLNDCIRVGNTILEICKDTAEQMIHRLKTGEHPTTIKMSRQDTATIIMPHMPEKIG